MIDPSHPLSLTRQAKLLNFSRSGVYYKSHPVLMIALMAPISGSQTGSFLAVFTRFCKHLFFLLGQYARPAVTFSIQHQSVSAVTEPVQSGCSR